MKTSVAITLIVCGTVLMCVPHVTNLVGTSQAMRCAVELELKNFSLNAGLPSYHNTACLFGGMAIIVAGIIWAVKSRAK